MNLANSLKRKNNDEEHDKRATLQPSMDVERSHNTTPVKDEDEDDVATQEYVPTYTGYSKNLPTLGYYKKEGRWRVVYIRYDLATDEESWHILKMKLSDQFEDVQFDYFSPYRIINDAAFIEWLGTSAADSCGILSSDFRKIVLAFVTLISFDGGVTVSRISTSETPDSDVFKEMIRKLKEEGMTKGSFHIVVSDGAEIEGEKRKGLMEAFCMEDPSWDEWKKYRLSIDTRDTEGSMLVYDAESDQHVEGYIRASDILPNEMMRRQTIPIHHRAIVD
jgi:hypothetical protein